MKGFEAILREAKQLLRNDEARAEAKPVRTRKPPVATAPRGYSGSADGPKAAENVANSMLKRQRRYDPSSQVDWHPRQESCVRRDRFALLI